MIKFLFKEFLKSKKKWHFTKYYFRQTFNIPSQYENDGSKRRHWENARREWIQILLFILLIVVTIKGGS